MAQIHPTSVIEDGAELADDVIVGPLCYVASGAAIGAGTRLVAQATVLGGTTLGERNTVWPHATLGADPQDLKYAGEQTTLTIGDHNEIRENVTMHRGTANGGGTTAVGSDNLFMAGTHVAHDCRVGNRCVFANNVLLAGHIVVEDHAVIGGGVAIHHFVTVGQFAYIGGLSGVTHDCPPFMRSDGHPNRVRGFNDVALKRHRFPDESIERVREAYKRQFRQSNDSGVRKTSESLSALEADYPEDECITILCQFMRRTMIGVHGRYLETLRMDKKPTNPVK